MPGVILSGFRYKTGPKRPQIPWEFFSIHLHACLHVFVKGKSSQPK